MLLTPAVVAAARKVCNQWADVWDNGLLVESKFNGESADQFGRDARALYELVKPASGEMDWHPDTSSMLRIKAAAEAILWAHARQTAGNSGSH